MKTNLFAFLAALVVAASSATASAATLYRETFGRPVTDPQPDADAGGNITGNIFDWPTFRAETVGGNALLQTVGNNATGVSGNAAAGQPGDVANVNAGANSDGTFGAYPRGLYFISQNEQAPKLMWTSEFSVNSNLAGLTFGWRQGNDNDTAGFQLALRVGGQWVVSTATINSVGYPDGIGNFAASAQTKSVAFDPTAANWLTLNFDGTWDSTTNVGTPSTVPLATGAAPASNLSGVIDGFGLYSAIDLGTRRFDTFEVTGVPEPSSLTLAALAGLIVAAKRRK